MDLAEFEDEVAKGCSDWRKHSDVATRFGCGSGFCGAWEGHECASVPKVREWVKTPGVAGVVLFRNQDMWASGRGKSSCVVVGPDKTYKTVEECEGKWLNDLPSQRQYAECFVRAEGCLQ